MTKNVTVALSGASGTAYAVNLLRKLSGLNVDVDLVLSDGAKLVMRAELREMANLESMVTRAHSNDNLAAPIASGSYLSHGMVVAPCSSGTLAKIANGITDNLISRAAAVCLKEKRPLILLLREAPYSLPIIKNMLLAQEAGAIIMPASPSFYHNPKTIDDLLSTISERIIDLLKIENPKAKRWSGHA